MGWLSVTLKKSTRESMNSDQIKYKEAVERLDEIIAELDNDDVDVDELAEQVKEAVELIRLCKSRIDKAEMEVKKVVEDLNKESKENSDN